MLRGGRPDPLQGVAAAIRAVARGEAVPGDLPPAVAGALQDVARRLAAPAGPAPDAGASARTLAMTEELDARIRAVEGGWLGVPAGGRDGNRLVAAFDAMIAGLGALLGRLQGRASAAARAGQDLDGLAADMRQRSARQIDAVQAMLFNLDSVAQQIARNRELADGALRSVTETASATNELITGVEDINTAMGQISESSDRIVDVIKQIERMTMQTEMISINAGIEAARAGNAGRGFVLIAGEIRRLAMSSRELATGIGALVHVSQSAVRGGVDVAARASAMISSVREANEGVTGSVRRIAEASEVAGRTVADLTAAASSASTSAVENAQRAVILADAARLQSASITALASLAAEVAVDRALLAGLADEAGATPDAPAAVAPVVELF